MHPNQPVWETDCTRRLLFWARLKRERERKKKKCHCLWMDISSRMFFQHSTLSESVSWCGKWQRDGARGRISLQSAGGGSGHKDQGTGKGEGGRASSAMAACSGSSVCTSPWRQQKCWEGRGGQGGGINGRGILSPALHSYSVLSRRSWGGAHTCVWGARGCRGCGVGHCQAHRKRQLIVDTHTYSSFIWKKTKPYLLSLSFLISSAACRWRPPQISRTCSIYGFPEVSLVGKKFSRCLTCCLAHLQKLVKSDQWEQVHFICNQFETAHLNILNSMDT